MDSLPAELLGKPDYQLSNNKKELFPGVSVVKNTCLPMQQTQVRSLGQKDPLEKEMATHSSILAWKTPWTEKPGGWQSTGLQRVGHDLAPNNKLQKGLRCRKKVLRAALCYSGCVLPSMHMVGVPPSAPRGCTWLWSLEHEQLRQSRLWAMSPKCSTWSASLSLVCHNLQRPTLTPGS